MKKACFLMVVFMAVLASQLVSAATIRGTVYDLSLSPTEAIVEIIPTGQRVVASPDYSFEVPSGEYVITAVRQRKGIVEASTEEEITIGQGENLRVDLILFPDVDINGSLDFDGDVGIDPDEIYERDYLWLAVLVIFLAAGILIYFFVRRSRKESEGQEAELDEDAQKVLDFVTDQRRTTQSEIVKEFQHSKAKISLILSDLEDRGMIRKVKKGRGNIIIRN